MKKFIPSADKIPLQNPCLKAPTFPFVLCQTHSLTICWYRWPVWEPKAHPPPWGCPQFIFFSLNLNKYPVFRILLLNEVKNLICILSSIMVKWPFSDIFSSKFFLSHDQILAIFLKFSEKIHTRVWKNSYHGTVKPRSNGPKSNGNRALPDSYLWSQHFSFHFFVKKIR